MSLGMRYPLGPEDLEYRQLGDPRRRRVAAAAQRAWAEYREANRAQLIEPFPAVDAMRGNRASVAGKLVELGPIAPRDFVNDIGRPTLADGSPSEGWYFVSMGDETMQRVPQAAERFHGSVGAVVANEQHRVIARITGNPKMVVIGGVALVGLEACGVAALVGEAMFVDATNVTEGRASFAGEHDLARLIRVAPSADASPESTILALVSYAKLGDRASWQKLRSQWVLEDQAGSTWTRYQADREADEREWQRVQALLAEQIYDVRPVGVSPGRTVVLSGVARFEEMIVEVDHLAVRGEEGVAIEAEGLHPRLTLLRLDGGPWLMAGPTL
jgi:hypothetical protein